MQALGVQLCSELNCGVQGHLQEGGHRPSGTGQETPEVRPGSAGLGSYRWGLL